MAEAVIRRDVADAADRDHDVAIVGGGIYGATLALEATRLGLRPLLVEKDDFGHATSWNSHRIVHGGLRYLQDVDLARFRESVAERSWFLRHFPDLVRPLTCIMPLYGVGARRPSVMRLGLLINDLLSPRRNVGLRQDRRLERGGVLTPEEVRAAFPAVRQEGLVGGALWYDAVMVSSQRIVVEMLRWACRDGATCLNHVEATGLRVDDGRVLGITAVDLLDGRQVELHAPRVINAAGPWCREVAARLDRDVEELFRPSLAFNVLLDVEPLSGAAVAVAPPGPDGQTYFLYSRHGRLYAGTAHEAWTGGKGPPRPSDGQVERFLGDLRAAVPGLEARPERIVRTYAGLLPAVAAGSRRLAVREVIHDHAAAGGPAGLVSVSGVKFTTARKVAERTLRVAFPDRRRTDDAARPEGVAVPGLQEVRRRMGRRTADARDERPGDPSPLDPELEGLARRLVEEESACSVDDLLLRRTDWGEDPQVARTLRGPLADVVDEIRARRAATRRRRASGGTRSSPPAAGSPTGG